MLAIVNNLVVYSHNKVIKMFVSIQHHVKKMITIEKKTLDNHVNV